GGEGADAVPLDAAAEKEDLQRLAARLDGARERFSAHLALFQRRDAAARLVWLPLAGMCFAERVAVDPLLRLRRALAGGGGGARGGRLGGRRLVDVERAQLAQVGLAVRAQPKQRAGALGVGAALLLQLPAAELACGGRRADAIAATSDARALHDTGAPPALAQISPARALEEACGTWLRDHETPSKAALLSGASLS
ncbi:MAG: hypothetical protein VX017_10645, partial [Pseudomonadota bacterium]|nr:hypothetical protein [Pseudomonadota bacterium]